MLDYIIEVALTFVATACFGVIFNVSTKVIPYCGLVGAIGWAIYAGCINSLDITTVQAAFLSALFVAFISHVFARIIKMPVIVFSVSGVIPLVPGGTAYNTMRNIVEQDFVTGMENGMLVFMISGAIAMGLVFAEVIMQIVLRYLNVGKTSITSFTRLKNRNR